MVAHRLLTNVRLIDGQSDQPRDDVNILIKGDRFETITTDPITPPPDAEVTDLSGKTVLPGLFDCHAHLAWDGLHDIQLQSENDSTAIAAMKSSLNMRRYLETGVTTLRDLGVHYLGIESRNAALAGIVPGPRILAAGPPITITGGHCYWCGVEADGADGLRRMVRQLAKDGADLIKIIATPGSLGSFLFPGTTTTSHPSFTEDEVRAVVDEAHNLGRKVTAHATTPDGAHQVVRAGVDCLEHGTEFTDETIDLMLKQGTFVVPTFSAYWTQAHYGHLIGIPEDQIERRKKMLYDSDRIRGIKKAFDAGVNIAIGTDQGSPCTPPASLINELFLYMEYQIADDPMTVIKNATAQAAKLAGIDAHVGTIENGKVADFVVVDKDPLLDLENLYSPHRVYQNGELVVKDGNLVPEKPFFFTENQG